jgi:replicative DNA helicase
LLHFYDQLATMDELEEITTREVLDHNCKVVVIDQVDLIDASDRRMSEFELVSDTIKRCKQLARRLNIILIVLCQLNREADGVRPKKRHLRMSGRIEQDSDEIFGLYRPYEDDPNTGIDEHYVNYCECWPIKVRSGSTSNQMTVLGWIGSLQRFIDWPTDWDLKQIQAFVNNHEQGETPATPGRGKKKTGGKVSWIKSEEGYDYDDN